MSTDKVELLCKHWSEHNRNEESRPMIVVLFTLLDFPVRMLSMPEEVR